MADPTLYRKYRQSHVQLTKLVEFLERDMHLTETIRMGNFEIKFAKEENDYGTFTARKLD